MLSKKEKRLLRKQKKQDKFEKAKSRILSQFPENEKLPRIAGNPTGSDGPRVSGSIDASKLSSERSPRAHEPVSRFGSLVTWCRTRCDREGEWSWGESRNWSTQEWEEIIIPAFRNFQRLTWGEIDRQNSGTGHKMHHPHALGELCQEAIDRWVLIGLEEFADLVFRFRLGNTKRAWGFILESHFFLVWWERDHNIYPVS